MTNIFWLRSLSCWGRGDLRYVGEESRWALSSNRCLGKPLQLLVTVWLRSLLDDRKYSFSKLTAPWYVLAVVDIDNGGC